MKRGLILLRILGIVALVMVGFAWIAYPVFAIAEPTSVSLDNIVVFQDLLYTDDFLAVVPYNIPFTLAPDENIAQTFIFRMIDTDNVTELGAVLASPAYDDGYGSGIVSFYFASGVAWNQPYIFRVQQNPTYYPAGQTWDFIIGESNYSSSSDQAAALKTKVVDSATFLTTTFGVALLGKSEAGVTVLSTYGELYYLNAIPALQSMCPSLFEVQLTNPDYTKRSWDTAFAEALKTKYSGTIFYEFMTGYAGLFNMETSAAMMVLSIIAFVAMVLVSVWKFKANMMSAFIDGYTLLLLLMLQGFFPMIAAGAVAFCSVALGGVILFLNRA